MKPTNSKLLLLDENAYWWQNEKDNADFVFFSKDRWWIIRSNKPTEKPTEKPTIFSKKSRKAKPPTYSQLTMVILSSALGISLALNFVAFLIGLL